MIQTMAVQAALVAAVAVAVSFVTPLSVRFRHALLLVAAAKFVVPPIWSSPTSVMALPRPGSTTVPLFAIAIYVVGALLVATRLILGHLRLRRITTNALARDGYLVSDAVTMPIAAGIFRRVVILPNRTFDAATLRGVLAHERAHHEQHDLLIAAVVNMLTIVWWFHPAVWLVALRIRVLRELRCDERVVARGIDADAYCTALLGAGTSCATQPLAAAALGGGGRSLARRIRHVMTRTPRAALGWRGAAVVALLAMAVLPAPLPQPSDGPDEAMIEFGLSLAGLNDDSPSPSPSPSP